MPGEASLMDNKLLWQYLSAFGSSFGQGGDWMGALNQVTQQNIGAQNQAGLIKVFGDMLKGNVPEGGKITMDKDGMKLNVPSTLYNKKTGEINMGALDEPGSIGNMEAGGPSGIDPSIMSKLLNPSSSQPSISASDLAGLSTTDISNALSGALNIEGLKQKRQTDLVDMIYKLALSKKALEGEPLDQPYPIAVPGVGQVSVRQWQGLPDNQKQYAAYVNIAKKLGDKDILSYEDFVNTFDKTEREKFLRAAMEDPKLMEAAKDLAQSGATRISVGEKVETAVKTKEALNAIEAKAFLGSGKFPDAMSKHMSSEEVQQRIFNAQAANPKMSRSDLERNEKIDYIEDILTTAGAKYTYSLSEDGVTVTWNITWPDGKKGKFSYAFR